MSGERPIQGDINIADWHVGMKVVCVVGPEIIAAMQAIIPAGNCPQHNHVYTLREIRDDAPWRHGERHIVVLLQEIDNSHLIGQYGPHDAYAYVEPGFNPRGFRPAQTRKTDISVFTAMLHDQRQKAPA